MKSDKLKRYFFLNILPQNHFLNMSTFLPSSRINILKRFHKNMRNMQETIRLTRDDSCKASTTCPSCSGTCLTSLEVFIVFDQSAFRCTDSTSRRLKNNAEQERQTVLVWLTRAWRRPAGSGDTWLSCRQRSGLPNTRLGRRRQPSLYAEAPALPPLW